MWHLSKPPADVVTRFLAAERALPFSYPNSGTTRDAGPAPDGFVVDHNRQLLGTGRATFERARAAIRAWQMFPAPWTQISPGDAPIVQDQVVAVMIRVYGVWFTNSARIVYVVDEPRRFAFAYGTLPGHVESGEERFCVEWLDDDTVWYDLRAFSRPRMLAARIGNPIVRQLQRRFGRESKAAMLAATR